MGHLTAKNKQREQTGEAREEGSNQGRTIYDSQNCPAIGGIASGYGDDASLRQYVELTQSGEFYDFLVAAMDGMSRDEIKRRFLCDVLAKRKANKRGDEYRSDVEDRFAVMFPPVYRYVRAFNKNGWEHANLIRELQRAESSLVIADVCEGLRVRHPAMFVVSLHDAVFSTEEHMPTVRAEFDRAFNEAGYSMALSED